MPQWLTANGSVMHLRSCLFAALMMASVCVLPGNAEVPVFSLSGNNRPMRGLSRLKI